MYKIGKRLICPMYGGCVVQRVYVPEGVEPKVKYYELAVLCDDLILNIPVSKAKELGLREASAPSCLKEIEKVLGAPPAVKKVKSVAWNRRQQLYTERIKSGDPVEVAAIYKILWLLQGSQRISVGEKRFYKTCRRILQTEIMLILDKDAEYVSKWIDDRTK